MNRPTYIHQELQCISGAFDTYESAEAGTALRHFVTAIPNNCYLHNRKDNDFRLHVYNVLVIYN